MSSSQAVIPAGEGWNPVTEMCSCSQFPELSGSDNPYRMGSFAGDGDL